MQRFKPLWQHLQQAGRLMVGVGDYQAYLAHMAEKHPELPPLSEAQYFRQRQEARYPGKSATLNRCPC